MSGRSSKLPVIAAGALGAFLLCLGACGEDPAKPAPAGAASSASSPGANASAPTAGDPTPLVALMRELDVPWSNALEASGWLEGPELASDQASRWRTQLERAAAQVKAMLGDPRFAAPSPALDVVFGAMKEGLGASFAQWAAAGASGDPEALRRARTSVETSCVACHRSMRDDAPAKLAVSMRRWETLHLRLREQALAIEAAPADLGKLAQMAGAASELASMADSGILRALAGAPPEHDVQRARFQQAAEALRGAAEKREAAAAITAFGGVGYACLSCHEARSVMPRPR
ncbi:MAG: cytochrome c [Planctomycetes bacterium]|nr:cytochrome c [Planctomycetota bacterium]